MRVLATRLGYADLDTLVQVPQDGSVVEFRLERDAVALPPLTVAAERRMTSRELHRTMFDREVVVGAVGMTQAEIKAVPTVGEPDVFRSLQAAAGIESKTVEFDGDEAAARARAWANNAVRRKDGPGETLAYFKRLYPKAFADPPHTGRPAKKRRSRDSVFSPMTDEEIAVSSRRYRVVETKVRPVAPALADAVDEGTQNVRPVVEIARAAVEDPDSVREAADAIAKPERRCII